MPRVDLIAFYDQALAKYGATAQGVQWQNSRRQEQRFEAILSMIDTPLSGCVIADAGCGVGHMFDYMVRTFRVPKQYIGIDMHPSMVHLAHQNTKQVILERDIIKDVLPFADYYLSSGLLNLLTPFESVQAINTMLKYSRKGVVFNALLGVSDAQSTYNKFTQKQLHELLSPFNAKITMHEGYIDGDITVRLIKTKAL